MSVRVLLNTVAVLSFTLAAVPAAAQTGAATVQLSVVVPARASATRVGTPVVRSVSDGLAEHVMEITVDANAPYRVSARRATSADSATLVRAIDGQRLALRARDDIVVAHGGRGVRVIELSYWVPAERATVAGAEPPAYMITLEPNRHAP